MYLMSLGHSVKSPSLGDFSFKNSVTIAQQAHDEFQPDVIVGSSRGAAVAMNLETTKPLILLAPAWKTFGGASNIDNKRCTIIHSANDDVVPFDDSLELFENTTYFKCEHYDCHHYWDKLTGETRTIRLCKVGEDHRLNDEEAKEALKKALLSIQ